jgi:hypothetical protein
MTSPEDLFLESLHWLATHLSAFTFYVERDLVWTLQTRLNGLIQEKGLPYRVCNDYGILPGKRRALSADIVILDEAGSVGVAAEFKYEPDHSRTEIPKNKFPVVFWGKDGVLKDIQRIQRYVIEAGAKHAFAIFVDEGGYFRKREPHPGSRWIDLPGPTSILWAQASRTPGQ